MVLIVASLIRDGFEPAPDGRQTAGRAVARAHEAGGGCAADADGGVGSFGLEASSGQSREVAMRTAAHLRCSSLTSVQAIYQLKTMPT